MDTKKCYKEAYFEEDEKWILIENEKLKKNHSRVSPENDELREINVLRMIKISLLKRIDLGGKRDKISSIILMISQQPKEMNGSSLLDIDEIEELRILAKRLNPSRRTFIIEFSVARKY